MSLHALIRRGRRSAAPVEPARPRLRVRQLECRTVPTVVFLPHFGLEPTSDGPGAVLSDTPVYLLFWGSYWNTTAGSSSKQSIISSINHEYNSSMYGRLSQYTDAFGDTAGPAYVLATWTATEYPDPSPSGFADYQIQSVVRDAINDPNSPILSPIHTELNDGGHAPIYLVITPPNIAWSGAPGSTGYHSEYLTIPQSVLYGWIGNFGSMDGITVSTSRVTADAMTDPAGNSWSIQPASFWPFGGSWGEIGDFEARSYTYRIYGSLTRAFWDNNAQVFTIKEGNAQKFFVEPQWSASNQYLGGTLVINGNQLPSNNGNDTIYVNTTPSGGLVVNLNGEVVSFDPGQITALDIRPGGGLNTVNVLSTPLGMTTQIDDQGQDTVKLGYGGSTANILGDIHVYGSGSTSLFLYDGSDTT